MTNLEWLTTASGLKNIRCVACQKELKTGFDGISIIDSLEAVRWVRQDELVLTTGYFLVNSPKEQKRLIKELKETGCAGLGIKIKKYFQEIPKQLIEEAEKINFPILELPYYYSLSELSQTIYNHIFEMNYQQRMKEQRLIEDISDIFFSKRGVLESIYRIAEYLNRTVILTDGEFRCVYAAKKMVDKKLCIRGDTIRRLTESEEKHAVFLFPDKEQHQAYYRGLPNGENFLVIIEDKSRISKSDEHLIERSTKILSMGLEQLRIKKEMHYDMEEMYYREMYEYLNGLKEYNDEKLKEVFQKTEFPYEKRRLVILFQMPQEIEGNDKFKSMVEYAMTKCREARRMESYFFYHSNKYILYLLSETEESNPFFCYVAEKVSKLILEGLREKVEEGRVRVGIGMSSQDIKGVRRGYQEAVRAIDIGIKLGSEEEIFSYNSIGFYDLFLQYPLNIKKQPGGNLDCLKKYDEENNTELKKTLLAFLECKFNMTETAKVLYIHRNTLINRLNRIKELLYNNLETMDELMPLCTEAYMYKLFS